MSIYSGETVIAVGKTDGFRYVGVVPPLDKDEIDTMQWAGTFDSRFHIEQIDEFEPHCSLMSVGGESGMSPDDKDAHAHEVATRIAASLSHFRAGPIRQVAETVFLQGHNSTPFYPNTDALRRPQR